MQVVVVFLAIVIFALPFVSSSYRVSDRGSALVFDCQRALLGLGFTYECVVARDGGATSFRGPDGATTDTAYATHRLHGLGRFELHSHRTISRQGDVGYFNLLLSDDMPRLPSWSGPVFLLSLVPVSFALGVVVWIVEGRIPRLLRRQRARRG